MKINFTTNIDCCKRFMSAACYRGNIAPNQGDYVVVLSERNKLLEMKVARRVFYVEDNQMAIEIELGLKSMHQEMGLVAFEKWINS